MLYTKDKERVSLARQKILDDNSPFQPNSTEKNCGPGGVSTGKEASTPNWVVSEEGEWKPGPSYHPPQHNNVPPLTTVSENHRERLDFHSHRLLPFLLGWCQRMLGGNQDFIHATHGVGGAYTGSSKNTSHLSWSGLYQHRATGEPEPHPKLGVVKSPS